MARDPLNDVAAVIVTFNSEATIAATLEQLPTARLASCVVVDNGSADGTVAVIAGLGLPGVDLVHADNRGFGAGNNIGVEHGATSRFVLFLNPDATIDATNLERLVAYADAHPTAALVAPRLWRGGTPIASAGRLASFWTEARGLVPAPLSSVLPCRSFGADYDVSGPVGYVEGACMLADAAAFRQVGGFDDWFFLFFEELDLARRFRSIGRDVHLCADASARHAVGVSRADMPDAGHAALLTSTVKYFAKWHGLGAANRYRRFALACCTAAALARRVDTARVARRRRAIEIGWEEARQRWLSAPR